MTMKAFFFALQVGEYLVYLRGFLHPLFIVLDLVLDFLKITAGLGLSSELYLFSGSKIGIGIEDEQEFE